MQSDALRGGNAPGESQSVTSPGRIHQGCSFKRKYKGGDQRRKECV